MPSGPRTASASPGSSAQSARVPGPIGSIRNASSPARREAERHRPRQQPARRLEHEELPGHARVEPAAVDAEQRVRADRLDGDDRYAARVSASIRSWSESAGSARAFAIACTAAARAGERRDARDARDERGLADPVAVRARAASPAAC